MKMDSVMIPRVVERLRALADESRLRLLMRLHRGPANVSTLTTELTISQASVSKHLAVLRQVGLVQARRVGTQAIYAVADESVFEMCQIVCDGVARQIRRDQALLRAAMRRPPSAKR